MDLKETKQLIVPAEIKLHTKSEKNKSNTQAIYHTLFPEEEHVGDTYADSNHTGKHKFGNVSTLDWIQTWRAFEIN